MSASLSSKQNLQDYERTWYIPGEKIYKNLVSLIQEKPELQTIEEPVVFYFMNGNTGFGSQLTQFMQNLYAVQCIISNPNIYCFPYFFKNESNFRYFDDRSPEVNTFFRYFTFLRPFTHDIRKIKKYYIMTRVVSSIPFFEYYTPPIEHPTNALFMKNFSQQYELRVKNESIGVELKNFIDHIRNEEGGGCPLFGIQIRSMAQKLEHSSGYSQTSMEERLRRLKATLDLKYPSFKVFIATDTNLYIQYAREIFGEGDTYFLPYISRIPDEKDSIPMLQNVWGYKLGTDILLDCYGLSLCDEIYVSNSNVPFIVNAINQDVVMKEY